MSNHEHWLEFQGGCYGESPCCDECGYELCEHAICRHCIGCANCDADEETEQLTRKPSISVPARTQQRKTG
jgi:hypothetical protein